MIKLLLQKCGLEIVKESKIDESGKNTYYSRDYICVVKKCENSII